MAMVGLFWITEDSVYVGSPTAVDGRSVRLDTEGVEAVDPDGSRAWTWADLRSATVEGVTVRGTIGARLGLAVEALLSAGAGLGSGSPEMTLRLVTADATEDVPVPAAASGYGSEEIALSQSVLARFVAGTAEPATLVAWGRHNSGRGAPKPREREELLRAWTEV